MLQYSTLYLPITAMVYLDRKAFKLARPSANWAGKDDREWIKLLEFLALIGR